MQFVKSKISPLFQKLKSKIIQDFIKVLSGNLISQGIGFFIVIMLSRELGPEQFGIYSSLIVIFELLKQFSNFGLSTSYVKYGSTYKSDENLYQNIFSTSLISTSFLSFLFGGFVYFFSEALSSYFFETLEYQFLIKVFAFILISSQILNLFIAHFQAKEDFKNYSILLIAGQFIRILAVLYALYYLKNTNPQLFVYIYVGANLILIFLLMYVERKLFFGKINFSLEVLKNIYSLGFWVFLSSIAVIIVLRIDTLMLLKMRGEVEVGIYSAALQLSRIFPLLTGTLTIILLPKLPKLLEQFTYKEYIKKVLSYLKYVVLLLFIIELFSPFLIKLLFGENYLSSIFVFQILLVSFFVGIIVNPIALIFYHIEKAFFLTVLNWVQLIVNYILNLYFINLWGAVGAATSTLFVRIIGGLGIVISLYFFINLSKNVKGNFKNSKKEI